MNRVIIKQCTDYDFEAVHKAIQESITELGGINNFVAFGDKVLIKPNILFGKSPESCVNTHPIIVEAVVKLLKEAGCIIRIGDSPGFGKTIPQAKKVGYDVIAEKYNVDIVEFDEAKTVYNTNGKIFKKFEIAENALWADKIINLPKLKTHAMMNMTLSVKNMFGLIPGTRKAFWHLKAGYDYNYFAKMFIELFYFKKPVLNILDGIIGMEGNGPANGEPKPIGVIITGDDGLAVDRIACEIVNVNNEKVYIFKASEELGYNSWYLENIEYDKKLLDDIRISDFKKVEATSIPTTLFSKLPKFMTNFLKKLVSSRPKINHNLCKRCGICIKHCPPAVMAMVKNKNKEFVKINYDGCIRCFCCQELCPYSAITVKKGLFVLK